MTDVIERLKQIADHDWRVSFLAHTSDTAREAAQEIERLRFEAAHPQFRSAGSCNHSHYEFEKHGRHCTCGALMVDLGD